MKATKYFILCALINAFVLCKSAADDGWWKHAVFYQIYPRSFQDSDGDGIGDLQGIIRRLPHLKEAGVTAAWLSPIYQSPQVDAGYDISDYKAINEEYGTMEDFAELVQVAKDLGLKIVMDFVPNHSSMEHEWFKKSENREAGYEDYYVWADGRNNDDITPPNNWVSNFKYAAWTYSTTRKQWYYHNFAPQQPDLNYESEALVAEMKDVLFFWMEKGVDGFRIDAIPYLFETGMDDEPLSGDVNATPDDYEYLNHIYTADQPETFDMVYQFREFIDAYNNENNDKERIMMTEAYASMENTMKYYGDGDRLGAHFSFNFQLITAVTSISTARDVVISIKEWLDYMPSQYVANWVIGNHDQPRVASRMGIENVDGFNMLVAMLPGVAVTYQGEEIGMENGYVSWEDGQDPRACNGSPEDFNSTSRDFERTPYHWDGTKNAGFSEGDSTWLPVSDKYIDNNLELQLDDENSHYGIYKQITALRATSGILANGKLQIEAYSDAVIALRRYAAGEKTSVFLFNIAGNVETVDLTKIFSTIGAKLSVKVSTKYSTGEELDTDSIILQANESLIAEEI